MLIGNYSVLNKTPGRWLSGRSVSDTRANFNNNGSNRNRSTNASWSKVYGHPRGYRPPYSWILSKSSGGMASTNLITGAGTITATIIEGRPITASMTGTGTFTASLGLVVPATGSSVGTSSVTAVLGASGVMTGDSTGTSSATGTLGARGLMAAALAGTSTCGVTFTATGSMEAAILPYSDLSPEGLSAAVWSDPEADKLLTTGKFLALK